MPFVCVHKAAAKRRRKRRPRPEWQDVAPEAGAQRASYNIAAKHTGRFSNAYTASIEDLTRKIDRQELIAALESGNPVAVTDVIPWFDPNDPAAVKQWQSMRTKYENAYASIIAESGAAEVARLKLPMSFTMDNPFSVPWIKGHTGDMITSLSKDGIKTVRAVVESGFELGMAPKEMAREILGIEGHRLGLTQREWAAVRNRERSLLEQGLSRRQAQKMSDKYADKLYRVRARRIARTETITAEGKGLQDSWMQAREGGFVTSKAQKEWIAAGGSERTCEICLELDGKKVPLDESWESAIVGTVDSPGTAHVNCRCTAALVEPP